MKNRVFISLFALFAAVGVFAQQQLPVVAVAPFEARSGVSAAEADMITRVFFIQLGNVRQLLTLVNREVAARVIREHNFQAGDWSDTDKTAELGRALNANWIVRGEIEGWGANTLVTVQFYDIQSFQFMGGTYVRFPNTADPYDHIDPLVENLVTTIAGSGTGRAAGARTPARASSVPDNFVRIEGGTFVMGSDPSEAGRQSNETQRRVTISPFYMSKHAVTQAEWEEVMGSNPSNFRGFNLPVERVNWLEAVDYCNRRSVREGLTPAYTISGTNVTWNRGANGYRLPTEAEWEYACRAGTTTPFNTGFNITTSQANHTSTPGRTMPVGSFAPNAWGLYDMHGNVWEWCWDWFGEYGVAPVTDPSGPVSGSARVLRGGSWSSLGVNLRSARRFSNAPSDRSNSIGFRLVRPIE